MSKEVERLKENVPGMTQLNTSSFMSKEVERQKETRNVKYYAS